MNTIQLSALISLFFCFHFYDTSDVIDKRIVVIKIKNIFRICKTQYKFTKNFLLKFHSKMYYLFPNTKTVPIKKLIKLAI